MRKISAGELREAIEQAALPPGTFERIQAALMIEAGDSATFEPAHVSYYLGSLLIIGAMSWFITSAWDRLSGATISAIAIFYGVLFGSVGFRLFRKPSTKIPGGLLVTVAVCITPMAMYGIERTFGWWPASNPGPYSHFHPLISANWIAMECATIAAAAGALRFVPFLFITAPAAYALWYLSMDATALVFGANWTFHQECWISVAFGLSMLLSAYFIDGRRSQDFSFWLYLFGLLTFTGGLTLMGDGTQLGKAMYCLIHLLLMLLALILQRKAFLIFGAIGVFTYLMGEAEGYFHNSFGFTIALTLIGLLFIAAGIAYKQNEAALEKKLAPFVPRRVRQRNTQAVLPQV